MSCAVVTFFVFWVNLIFPLNGLAASFSLVAPSYALLDGKTYQLIESRSPYTRKAPASTTKLLTAMVALDHLGLSRVVIIPSGLESVQPSKIGLRAGERFYVQDLVRASLIKSANDASEALAIVVAGSRPAFARLMNQKAAKIGAKNSHFVNPSGLPAEGQYSTAYDLAKIMMAASRYSFIVNTLKTRQATIRTTSGRKIFLQNCNKMLWQTNGIIGKTGWTRNARHCFAGRVQLRGKEVFVGIMGSPKRSYLWYDLRKVASVSSGKKFNPIKVEAALPSRSETIKIQKALRRAGCFKGNATGFYGKRTRAAVRQFQRQHRLPMTGTVGPRTRAKLQRYFS